MAGRNLGDAREVVVETGEHHGAAVVESAGGRTHSMPAAVKRAWSHAKSSVARSDAAEPLPGKGLARSGDTATGLVADVPGLGGGRGAGTRANREFMRAAKR